MFSELNEGPARTAAFWAREAPVKAGKHVYQFGFDAELWQVSDIFDIIAKDPTARAEAAERLLRKRDFYTLPQIMRITESESLEAAGELVESRLSHEGILLTDLKPHALRKWKHTNVEKSRYADLLFEQVDASLKNRGIPVSAKLEGWSGVTQGETSVELVMDGAIASPAEFKRLVDWLYDEVDGPETHFHVSVPKEFIESDAMIFAARALETKIILEQALSGQKFEGQGHYPWDETSLFADLKMVREEDKPQSERGVVRVESERWEEPFVAHDVEVRDWVNKDHGLESLYVMTELARHSQYLRDSSDFETSWVRKLNPANLNSALRYAAYMLEGRLPKSKEQLIKDLLYAATSIEHKGKLDKALLDEIATYFKEHNLLYYLTLNTFLDRRILPKNQPLPVVEIPMDPLPEPSLVDGIRTTFVRDKEKIRMPLVQVREGKPDKPIAEFILDAEKAERSSTTFRVRDGEAVSFFDWKEPEGADHEQVRSAAITAIRHAFNDLGQARLVAIGGTHYERTNLQMLGFSMIPSTINLPGGPRFELAQHRFKDEVLPSRFLTHPIGDRSLQVLTNDNSRDLPQNRVANGIHHEYYVPNEYKPHEMRLSIEKVAARAGGRPKHLAEFILDSEKPLRSNKFGYGENGSMDRPAYFDWEEATRVADADYPTIYENAREFLKDSFTRYGFTRFVAVGTSEYSKDVLEELGFTLMPGQNGGDRELRYELRRQTARRPVPRVSPGYNPSAR